MNGAALLASAASLRPTTCTVHYYYTTRCHCHSDETDLGFVTIHSHATIRLLVTFPTQRV